MNTEDKRSFLKAIEGYLANKGEHGDDLALSLRIKLLELWPALNDDSKYLDQIEIEHWNSPRYGGDALDQAGQTFTAEVVDQREGHGQLSVTIADNNGDIDEHLHAAFEVTTLPGSTASVASLMLYDGEEFVARVVRSNAGHLVVPGKPGVRLEPSRLQDAQDCWLLSCDTAH